MINQTPEELVSTLTEYELAEMLLDMSKESSNLESQMELLFAHARGLEIENKTLRERLESMLRIDDINIQDEE